MEDIAWWVEQALTLAGILVGAKLIVYQLGKQHKNELDVQAESHRSELKLKVYQEFSEILSNATAAASDVKSYAFHIPFHTASFARQAADNMDPAPIRDRAIAFSDLHHHGQMQIVQVLFMIEKYAIIHPDLNIFKTALSSNSTDCRRRWNDLNEFLIQALPFDREEGGVNSVMNARVLAPDAQEKLEGLVGAYVDCVDDLAGYLTDIRNEVQSVLLGPLFPGNVLPRRKPIDSRRKVLSLHPDVIPKLREYFLTQTEWGRDWAEAKRVVIEDEKTRRG
jgi:hypothetical protein